MGKSFCAFWESFYKVPKTEEKRNKLSMFYFLKKNLINFLIF